MTTEPSLTGLARIGSFGTFFHRFDELLAESTALSLYFIHSRRWRENHDAAIKAFVRRPGVTLDVFLPDLENHELMFSLARHFDDGPLIPGLIVDATGISGGSRRSPVSPSNAPTPAGWGDSGAWSE